MGVNKKMTNEPFKHFSQKECSHFKELYVSIDPAVLSEKTKITSTLTLIAHCSICQKNYMEGYCSPCPKFWILKVWQWKWQQLKFKFKKFWEEL